MGKAKSERVVYLRLDMSDFRTVERAAELSHLSIQGYARHHLMEIATSQVRHEEATAKALRKRPRRRAA
jgi:hypothetical protein